MTEETNDIVKKEPDLRDQTTDPPRNSPNDGDIKQDDPKNDNGAPGTGEKTIPAEEKDAAKGNDGPQSPQTVLETHIKNNKGQVQMADKIVNSPETTNNEIKQIFYGNEKRIRVKGFSLADSFPIGRERVHELHHTFVYPKAGLKRMTETLEKWRLLLITGDPHSGKYETAQYLSMQLESPGERQPDIRYIHPMSREVEIDMIQLIRETPELKNKILVFKNSFAKNNPGMVEFFNTCSKTTLEFFAQRLKESGAYIIFTAGDGTYKPFEYSISKLPFKVNISTLDDDLLEKGLEKKLKRFCHLKPQIDLEKGLQLLEREKEKIIRQLKKMPRIAVFIEEYLEKVLNNEKNIADALGEVNDTGRRLQHWFLKELTRDKGDFEVWTFALCLALFNYSRYVDFFNIHREVTRQLLQHFDPFETYEQFAYTLSESELLRRCHAQISKDILTYSDTVEFVDERYAGKLLDILLRSNRNVLLFIVPMLREYVETHHRPSQRRFAAVSLGRIGVIDPESITLPVIDNWARKDEKIQRVNVGYLFEGVIASGDPVYMSICLQNLKHMALSMNIEQQWTAIAAYKQIGFHRLDIAMEELQYIQKEIVERMFKKQTVLDFIYSGTGTPGEVGVLTIL
ncbi:MAG: hypothetical protein GY757_55325, partial [bacterium]|nr:hypothetical protein [bacterium]